MENQQNLIDCGIIDYGGETFKECSKCGDNKDLRGFRFRVLNKRIEINSQCKNCELEYRLRNRDKLILQSREYTKKNKEKILLRSKQYYKKHKKSTVRDRPIIEEIWINGMKSTDRKCIICKEIKKLEQFEFRKDSSKFRNRCKICVKLYQKKWRENNKEYKSKKDKIYQLKNKNKIRENKKLYNQNNKKIINEKRKERLRNDVNFKILSSMRSRIWQVLKGISKSQKTINLLGCSVGEFNTYLQSKFLEGMNWNNYGKGENKWEIDHIIPCASFDLTKPEEQKKCFHWSNMQPLWQEDNRSKSDKLPHEWTLDTKNDK